MPARTAHMAILILAAGASNRMGQMKQLLPWKKTTLLDHAIDNAKKLENAAVFVVLGAHSEKVRKNSTAKHVVFIDHIGWRKGIGSSIAHGIGHIMATGSSYSSVLMLLCDQPLIDPIYLRRMSNAFQKNDKGIIATTYPKGVGVPAIFRSNYFQELGCLNKDKGAQSIIKKYEYDVFALRPDGKEIDLDTKEEYEDLIRRTSNGNDT